MPALLGKALSREQQEACIQRVKSCLTDWGPATEQTTSPLYEADGYWRGPIWGPSTMLVVMGLQAIGANELADEVSKRYIALCQQSDFAENFDALSGAPSETKPTPGRHRLCYYHPAGAAAGTTALINLPQGSALRRLMPPTRWRCHCAYELGYYGRSP